MEIESYDGEIFAPCHFIVSIINPSNAWACGARYERAAEAHLTGLDESARP
jgi:hypothetical protein